MYVLLRKTFIPRAGGQLARVVKFASAAAGPVATHYPPFVKHHETLVEMQTNSCDRFKDNNFIGTWRNGTFDYVSYGQFGQDVDRFRAVLARYGVVRDDKVSIISNNRLEWAVAYYAANGRGAQLVPLYEAQTEQDWRFIVRNSDAKLLIVATEAIHEKTRSYLTQDFPCLQSIICLDGEKSGSGYRQLMAAVQPEDVSPPVPLATDDLTAIVYTSGSTGNPKGVCLTHRNIIANLKGICRCTDDGVVCAQQFMYFHRVRYCMGPRSR